MGVEQKGAVVSKWESKRCALEMMVHGSDISNVTKSTRIGLLWADRVLEEFFAQGDKEREAHMPISPLCDRVTVSKAKSQIGFVNFIVRPMFQGLSSICDVNRALLNLDAYQSHWAAVEEQD